MKEWLQRIKSQLIGQVQDVLATIYPSYFSIPFTVDKRGYASPTRLGWQIRYVEAKYDLNFVVNTEEETRETLSRFFEGLEEESCDLLSVLELLCYLRNEIRGDSSLARFQVWLVEVYCVKLYAQYRKKIGQFDIKKYLLGYLKDRIEGHGSYFSEGSFDNGSLFLELKEYLFDRYPLSFLLSTELLFVLEVHGGLLTAEERLEVAKYLHRCFLKIQKDMEKVVLVRLWKEEIFVEVRNKLETRARAMFRNIVCLEKTIEEENRKKREIEKSQDSQSSLVSELSLSFLSRCEFNSQAKLAFAAFFLKMIAPVGAEGAGRELSFGARSLVGIVSPNYTSSITIDQLLQLTPVMLGTVCLQRINDTHMWGCEYPPSFSANRIASGIPQQPGITVNPATGGIVWSPSYSNRGFYGSTARFTLHACPLTARVFFADCGPADSYQDISVYTTVVNRGLNVSSSPVNITGRSGIPVSKTPIKYTDGDSDPLVYVDTVNGTALEDVFPTVSTNPSTGVTRVLCISGMQGTHAVQREAYDVPPRLDNTISVQRANGTYWFTCEDTSAVISLPAKTSFSQLSNNELELSSIGCTDTDGDPIRYFPKIIPANVSWLTGFNQFYWAKPLRGRFSFQSCCTTDYQAVPTCGAETVVTIRNQRPFVANPLPPVSGRANGVIDISVQGGAFGDADDAVEELSYEWTFPAAINIADTTTNTTTGVGQLRIPAGMEVGPQTITVCAVDPTGDKGCAPIYARVDASSVTQTSAWRLTGASVGKPWRSANLIPQLMALVDNPGGYQLSLQQAVVIPDGYRLVQEGAAAYLETTTVTPQTLVREYPVQFRMVLSDRHGVPVSNQIVDLTFTIPGEPPVVNNPGTQTAVVRPAVGAEQTPVQQIIFTAHDPEGGEIDCAVSGQPVRDRMIDVSVVPEGCAVAVLVPNGEVTDVWKNGSLVVTDQNQQTTETSFAVYIQSRRIQILGLPALSSHIQDVSDTQRDCTEAFYNADDVNGIRHAVFADLGLATNPLRAFALANGPLVTMSKKPGTQGTHYWDCVMRTNTGVEKARVTVSQTILNHAIQSAINTGGLSISFASKVGASGAFDLGSMVSDADGVPADIAFTAANFPDGITYDPRRLYYFAPANLAHGIYRGELSVTDYGNTTVRIRIDFSSTTTAEEANQTLGVASIGLVSGMIVLGIAGVGIFVFYRRRKRLLAEKEAEKNALVLQTGITHFDAPRHRKEAEGGSDGGATAISAFMEYRSLPPLAPKRVPSNSRLVAVTRQEPVGGASVPSHHAPVLRQSGRRSSAEVDESMPAGEDVRPAVSTAQVTAVGAGTGVVGERPPAQQPVEATGSDEGDQASFGSFGSVLSPSSGLASRQSTLDLMLGNLSQTLNGAISALSRMDEKNGVDTSEFNHRVFWRFERLFRVVAGSLREINKVVESCANRRTQTQTVDSVGEWRLETTMSSASGVGALFDAARSPMAQDDVLSPSTIRSVVDPDRRPAGYEIFLIEEKHPQNRDGFLLDPDVTIWKDLALETALSLKNLYEASEAAFASKVINTPPDFFANNNLFIRIASLAHVLYPLVVEVKRAEIFSRDAVRKKFELAERFMDATLRDARLSAEARRSMLYAFLLYLDLHKKLEPDSSLRVSTILTRALEQLRTEMLAQLKSFFERRFLVCFKKDIPLPEVFSALMSQGSPRLNEWSLANLVNYTDFYMLLGQAVDIAHGLAPRESWIQTRSLSKACNELLGREGSRSFAQIYFSARLLLEVVVDHSGELEERRGIATRMLMRFFEHVKFDVDPKDRVIKTILDSLLLSTFDFFGNPALSRESSALTTAFLAYAAFSEKQLSGTDKRALVAGELTRLVRKAQQQNGFVSRQSVLPAWNYLQFPQDGGAASSGFMASRPDRAVHLATSTKSPRVMPVHLVKATTPKTTTSTFFSCQPPVDSSLGASLPGAVPSSAPPVCANPIHSALRSSSQRGISAAVPDPRSVSAAGPGRHRVNSAVAPSGDSAVRAPSQTARK